LRFGFVRLNSRELLKVLLNLRFLAFLVSARRAMSDNGSCGGGSQPSEGSTASVKEDHSIITVDQSHENERLTTVVISNGNNDSQTRSEKIDNI
jgi:hypothetical protein